MGLQCRPRVEALGQFPLTECRVNFAVANAVYLRSVFKGLTTLAFGYQMVLIHTSARYQGTATQRALGGHHWRYVAQWIGTPQRAA